MNASDKNRLDVGVVVTLMQMRQQRNRTEECPGMVQVASVAAGGAAPEEVLAAARHLETCDTCRLLAREYSAVVSAAQEFSPGPSAEHRPGWPSAFRRFAWVAAVLLMVSGVLVATWLGDSKHPVQQPRADFMLKGAEDRLTIAVERGRQRFVAKPDTGFRRDDRLGFFYASQAGGYLTLLDLEKTGDTTVIFPVDAAQSSPIVAGEELSLPDNVTIQDIDGCEWLVGVFSDRALPIPPLRVLLGKAARQSQPGCQLSLTVPGARTVWIFPLRTDE